MGDFVRKMADGRPLYCTLHTYVIIILLIVFFNLNAYGNKRNVKSYTKIVLSFPKLSLLPNTHVKVNTSECPVSVHNLTMELSRFVHCTMVT